VADQLPLLLSLSAPSETAASLELPKPSENVYERLIRNPHLESATPRERECTEMLCSVLLNAPEVRRQFLQWLASLAAVSLPDLEEVEVSIDTEQPVGEKRDDLRIEAWLSDGNRTHRQLLWSIEVKVGAGFSYSPRLHARRDRAGPTDPELVNQIENYDLWLSEQPGDGKAGFVLAPRDKTHELLPLKLKCTWKCFTWTWLGTHIEGLIRTVRLDNHELFLARHLLGFIKAHLWSSAEMATQRIEFDDVVIMRTGPRIGDCERRVNRILSNLASVVAKHDIGFGDWRQWKTLFGECGQCLIGRPLFDPGPSADKNKYAEEPTVYAGIELGYLTVWVESSPENPQKKAITAAIKAAHSRLHARNPDWQAPGDVWPDWHDVKLKRPLTDLLDVDDQESAIQQFVVNALEDLKQAAVVKQIQRRIRSSK
jgi:hypothetical protein